MIECQSPVYAKQMCKMHYARVRSGKPLTDSVRVPRTGLCSVDECTGVVVSRGLCANHYRSLRLYGDLTHVQVVVSGCEVEGCGSGHYALGYCEQHYARQKRTGDPIKRRHGNFKGGHVNSDGYRVLSVDGSAFLEHRYIMEQMIGRPLYPNENVHHVNGVRDDNRESNLELWVKWQPPGQRVSDLVAWAHEVLDRYEKEQ